MSYIYRVRNKVTNPSVGVQPTLTNPKTMISNNIALEASRTLSRMGRITRITNQIVKEDYNQAWIIAELMAGAVDEIAIPLIARSVGRSIESAVRLSNAHAGQIINVTDELKYTYNAVAQQKIDLVKLNEAQDRLANRSALKARRRQNIGQGINATLMIAPIVLQAGLLYSQKQREINITNRETRYLAQFKGARINKR